MISQIVLLFKKRCVVTFLKWALLYCKDLNLQFCFLLAHSDDLLWVVLMQKCILVFIADDSLPLCSKVLSLACQQDASLQRSTSSRCSLKRLQRQPAVLGGPGPRLICWAGRLQPQLVALRESTLASHHQNGRIYRAAATSWDHHCWPFSKAALCTQTHSFIAHWSVWTTVRSAQFAPRHETCACNYLNE